MMNATEQLENDHLHILRLTDIMDTITRQEDIVVEDVELIIDLIRNFADGLHHNKEEELLFPKMVEKGFSFQQGPVAVMMNEHVQGRNFVKGMAENCALYKQGDKSKLEHIQQNMAGYVELLRTHIGKENNVLFRMADNALSQEEQENLSQAFKRIDQQSKNGFSSADCIAHIAALAKVYPC